MKTQIYINGEILPEDQAQISPLNPGFLFGEGLFETIRADEGLPFLLPEHLERLRASLGHLNIELPTEFDQIPSICLDLLSANQLNLEATTIKLICSRTNLENLSPTNLTITTSRLDLEGIRKRQRGIKAQLIPWCRDRKNPLLTLKSLNYLENRYALQAAKRQGFGEGIFLNQEGELCEGTYSNLFFIKEECLLTPPLNAGILPGTTRAFILKKALQIGIKCQETPLLPEDLKHCSGAFLTSSLMHLAPIIELNKINFDPKLTAPIRQRLLQLFPGN